MIPVLNSTTSTIGKKILMGLTGLALSLFIVGHFIGNTALFHHDPTPFNKYAHFLTGLGGLLYLIEAGLLLIFGLHISYGVLVTLGNLRARPDSYQMVRDAGGKSKKTIASSTMIYTGLVIMVFTILHVAWFKYGPGITEGYIQTVDGENLRDLYRLVYDSFANAWYMLWYVLVMLLLGLHLSHGFWSAFQSLGVNHPVYTPFLYKLGMVFAVIMALGFASIPIFIYLQSL